MLGWILLAIFVGFVLGFVGLIGWIELGYRIGRRRRERIQSVIRPDLNGVGLQLDSRERRRLVQRELDKLRR